MEIIDELSTCKGESPKRRRLSLELRRIGREYPAILIEYAHGDLSRVVPVSRIITGFLESSPEMIEAVMVKLDTMRQELAGASPPPIIRIAVEVAVACWLEFFMVEAETAGRLKNGNTSVSWRTFEVRRTEAHKRLMRSLVTLERIRSGINTRTWARTIDVDLVGEKP